MIIKFQLQNKYLVFYNMGYCNIEEKENKLNLYGSNKLPYGNVNNNIQVKTSNNNKNDLKIKNNDYEKVRSKVMKKNHMET
jgi:hypothetical protein